MEYRNRKLYEAKFGCGPGGCDSDSPGYSGDGSKAGEIAHAISMHAKHAWHLTDDDRAQIHSLAKWLIHSSDLMKEMKGVYSRKKTGNLPDDGYKAFILTYVGHASSGGKMAVRKLAAYAIKFMPWNVVKANPERFKNEWERRHHEIRERGGKFGNHRKFTAWISLGRAVMEYANMIKKCGGHQAFFDKVKDSPKEERFDALRKEIIGISGMGRLGAYDYAMMVSNMGLIDDMEPSHAHLKGATGPLRGARRLSEILHGEVIGNYAKLQQMIDAIDRETKLGMAAWEDALCMWQK